MRLFIAMQMPEQILSSLQKMQSQLQTFATKGNFTPKNNLHLTLKFLGETSIDSFEDIKQTMQGLKQFPAPVMSLTRVSSLRAADIICAKLKSQPSLFDIEKYLSSELERKGFTVERRAYQPHITLIRRYSFDMPFSEVEKNVTVYNRPFVADTVTLFETQFNPNASVSYNELFTIKLDESV